MPERRRAEAGFFRGCFALVVLLAVVAGLLLVKGGDILEQLRDDTQESQPIDAAPGGKPAYRGKILALVRQVEVIPTRPSIDGYDRECGAGRACSFGPAWSDDTAADGGHNGCDTRNDVLRTSLKNPKFEPGTNDCVVTAGQLRDPYTGETIKFRKDKAYEVGIDHIIPLALAWDLGAASWPPERRQTFANDPVNLVAVSGSANSSKSDRGPGEWLPINDGYRCQYLLRFLTVSKSYDLPITQSDEESIRTTSTTCPRRPTNEREHR